MASDVSTGGTGAQSVERAISVLMELAQAEPSRGFSLSELSMRLGLNKTTVRRLLISLQGSGLVAQNGAGSRYKLGIGLYALGLTAGRHTDLVTISGESLERIANEVGDTVLLYAWAGREAICLARRFGGYPLQVTAQDIGVLRPIGSGPGGPEMLSVLPQAEREAIIAALPEPLTPISPLYTKAQLTASVNRAAERGYHYHDGSHFAGVCNLGVAIVDPRGRPLAALVLAALAARLGEARVPEVLDVLRREKAVIEARIAGAA